MKAHYDIDSGTIQIWLPDGTLISVLRKAVEDELNLGPAQEGEFNRLLYDHPLELVEMLLTGQLAGYLKTQAHAQAEQEDVISAQLRAQGYSPTQADALAREFLRYDD